MQLNLLFIFVIASTLIIGFDSKHIFTFILLLAINIAFNISTGYRFQVIFEALTIAFGIFVIYSAFKIKVVNLNCLKLDLFSLIGFYTSFVLLRYSELIYKFYFFEYFEYFFTLITVYLVFNKHKYYFFPIFFIILIGINFQNQKLEICAASLILIFFYAVKYIKNANRQKFSQ